MGDFWIDLAFSVLFTLIKGLIKDPVKKEQYRRAFLKLAGYINMAYPETEVP